MTQLEKGKSLNYDLKNPQNGIYLFTLSGKWKVGNETVQERDGFGIWNVDFLEIEAQETTELLLMEVPMS